MRCHDRPIGLGLLIGCLLSVSTALAQPKPQRVASLNLCTDQLLLALADRHQIASLSRLALDPSVSFMAKQAAGLPLNESGAEVLMFSKPDLVLTGTYGQQERVAALNRQGLDVLQLGPWAGLAEGREQIRTLAGRLGYPDRGEALIARIDAALDRAKNVVPNGRSILVYERGGWVTDARSPLSEVLTQMGFTLHQEVLGGTNGGVVRLEAIVAAPPDVMLVDAGSQEAIDNGTALFAHPALAAAVPRERRLAIPGRLTFCGGPSTPAMIEALEDEVRSKLP